MGLTTNEFLVLKHLRNFPNRDHFGLSLVRETKLISGTVYAVLGRLENNGLVSSKLEEIDPQLEGRPRRKFYKITGVGLEAVEEHLKTLGVGWAWGETHA